MDPDSAHLTAAARAGKPAIPLGTALSREQPASEPQYRYQMREFTLMLTGDGSTGWIALPPGERIVKSGWQREAGSPVVTLFALVEGLVR